VRRKDRISKGVRMLQKQGYRVEQYTLYGRIIGNGLIESAPYQFAFAARGRARPDKALRNALA
jgi:hypothetical protein